MIRIPLIDLGTLHHNIRQDIEEAIRKTISESAFIMGDRVKKLEREFASFCGVRSAIATSSGTTALHLALLGCGVHPDDEVITVSHTFIATAEAICHCGAVPVFADIDPKTYNIDPKSLEVAITPRTRAVIPVHLYGQCADMDAVMSLAREHNLKVVEDCCQAHSATFGGRHVGGIGDFGCFSFFPGKNLGALGDAGMITTNDEDAAFKLGMLVNHGRKEKYVHETIGYNYRMDALQAAILSVKLPYLQEWTQDRRRIAARYHEGLQGLPVEPPSEKFGHVYHLYVIQCDDRDALRRYLRERGISTGVHYPVPLHMQPCFRDFPVAGEGRLPVTEKVASCVVSLPMYPGMTEVQQDHVIETIREFYR